VQSPLPQDESSRLESLTDLRIPDTSPVQVFDDVARLAALICDTPIAVIDFVDEQRVWFKAKIGLELDDIPRVESFSAHAILESDVLIVPDLYSSSRLVTIPVTVGLTNPEAVCPCVITNLYALTNRVNILTFSGYPEVLGGWGVRYWALLSSGLRIVHQNDGTW
jgi:hypothetical protein